MGFYLKNGHFVPSWIEGPDGIYTMDPNDAKIYQKQLDEMSNEEKHAWDMIEHDQNERTDRLLKEKGTSLDEIFSKLNEVE